MRRYLFHLRSSALNPPVRFQRSKLLTALEGLRWHPIKLFFQLRAPFRLLLEGFALSPRFRLISSRYRPSIRALLSSDSQSSSSLHFISTSNNFLFIRTLEYIPVLLASEARMLRFLSTLALRSELALDSPPSVASCSQSSPTTNHPMSRGKSSKHVMSNSHSYLSFQVNSFTWSFPIVDLIFRLSSSTAWQPFFKLI